MPNPLKVIGTICNIFLHLLSVPKGGLSPLRVFYLFQGRERLYGCHVLWIFFMREYFRFPLSEMVLKCRTNHICGSKRDFSEAERAVSD